MFRFLQELEQRLKYAALGGIFEEVLHLLDQGVNVDATDEVRHVIPCHVCFIPIALEGVYSRLFYMSLQQLHIVLRDRHFFFERTSLAEHAIN